ncbi:MAG: hypothetical protein ACREAE_06575 [Nitrosopumilaceae archaeon]
METKHFQIVASIKDSDIQERLGKSHPSLNIVGPFRIKIDSIFLPDPQWEDFVIIVISWWLNDLVTLLKETKVTCDFMDDNYKIDLVLNGNVLLLSAHFESSDEYDVKNVSVPLKMYVNELFDIAAKIEKQVLSVAPNAALICSDFQYFWENKKKSEKAWRDYFTKG